MQHLHVFPFSPWLYYTVFQNMRYKLKIDLEGGAVTTFCAAPMTSLLQGASFTVGMINSDRREFLGLLWLLSFAETKEMIARERIIIMEFSSDAHLSVYPSASAVHVWWEPWIHTEREGTKIQNNFITTCPDWEIQPVRKCLTTFQNSHKLHF